MLDPAALDILWASVENRLYVQRKDWEHALTKLGWSAVAVCADGKPTGAVLMRGHEVHIAGTGITRERLIAVIETLLLRHGRVTTRIPHENKREQAFADRLGFRKIGECKFDYHYQLKDNRYARSTH